MPYNVAKRDDEWCVYETDEDGNRQGEPVACHKTEDLANTHMSALYANVPDVQPSKTATEDSSAGVDILAHTHSITDEAPATEPSKATTEDIPAKDTYRSSAKTTHPYLKPDQDDKGDAATDEAQATKDVSDAETPATKDDTGTAVTAEPPVAPSSKGVASADDMLLAQGGEVKMQSGGKVQGYLVRFSDADNPDLEREYFDAKTDFALTKAASCPIYYHHGQDPVLSKRVLGEGILKMDDVGVWIDGQIDARDKYEEAVRQLGLGHKLSWSSGTAPHLVERDEPGPKATRISRWPLGLDASLTPTPAEPQNIADMKSFRALDTPNLKALVPEVFAEKADTGRDEVKSKKRKTDRKQRSDEMRVYASNGKWHVYNVGEDGEPEGFLPIASYDTEDEAKAYITDQTKPDALRMVELIDAQTKVTEALVTRIEAMQQAAVVEPRRGAALVNVVNNGSDEVVKTVNGKTFDDFMYAIVQNDTKTLAEMGAAKTVSEGTGASGAFMVPPTFIPELIRIEPEKEIVYPRADRQPVNGPVRLPGLSTAGQTAGRSNFMGGVAAVWNESGTTKPETEPVFSQIALNPWELTGYVAVEDQLLSRSAINLPQLLSGLFRDALMFYRDEAFLDGTGAGQPLGIINAPGTYIQSRQTAASVSYLDMVRMKGHLLPQSWTTAHWIFSISTYEELITMQDPLGYIWQRNAIDGEPKTLLGLPYVFTEKTPILGSQGDIILADENFYYVVEEGGISIAQSEHVYFLQNQTAFKFFLKVDGQEKLAAPVYLKDGATEVSPFVILGAAATT